jgi:hypothetical protein
VATTCIAISVGMVSIISYWAILLGAIGLPFHRDTFAMLPDPLPFIHARLPQEPLRTLLLLRLAVADSEGRFIWHGDLHQAACTKLHVQRCRRGRRRLSSSCTARGASARPCRTRPRLGLLSTGHKRGSRIAGLATSILGGSPAAVRSLTAEPCGIAEASGMKAARAVWQNVVAVNMSRHQRRQRSIVQRSTRTTRANPRVGIR